MEQRWRPRVRELREFVVDGEVVDARAGRSEDDIVRVTFEREIVLDQQRPGVGVGRARAQSDRAHRRLGDDVLAKRVNVRPSAEVAVERVKARELRRPPLRSEGPVPIGAVYPRSPTGRDTCGQMKVVAVLIRTCKRILHLEHALYLRAYRPCPAAKPERVVRRVRGSLVHRRCT